ncbi:MAG: hypothetical protein CL920_19300 [Deltaproteobacteria bacterium]|nr:hypothetical protein [Deltaproteobacteria bacterium]MBU50834.1 hypothetical protein [Deltaproteobacteria bacterium]|tara:strand:+ start:5056 stop:6153 length:1098 start_codon:yes stop_codon:yes gene_type:complete
MSGHTNTYHSAKRIAILLNGNARKVTQALVDQLSYTVPRKDIYFSKTLEEAKRFCQLIYEREYDLVFTGGGDGTLLNGVTELQRCHEQAVTKRRFPVLGVLHLGTGNAVAGFLGARANITKTIQQAQKTQGFALREQHWVEVNGESTPFAGTGLDSLMINHYKKLKDQLKDGPFAFLGEGLRGYLSALFVYTTPHFFTQPFPEIEVFNGNKPAYLLGPKGDYVEEFAPGARLYKGPAMMSSVSTVPCFGYGVKGFPFAESGQHMQLRLAFPPVLEALINIPRICRGTYRSKKLLDFHVEEVTVRSDELLPLQIGGDPKGYHHEVTYKLSEKATWLADFRAAQQLPARQPTKSLPPANTTDIISHI